MRALMIVMVLLVVWVGLAVAQTAPPEPPPDVPGFTATPNPHGASICYTFECTRTPVPTHVPTGTPPVHICNTLVCTPTPPPRTCPGGYTPLVMAKWYEAFIRPVWCIH